MEEGKEQVGFGHSPVSAKALLEGKKVFPEMGDTVKAFYEDKHVLVTGAAGSIGKPLYKALKFLGAGVFGIDHDEKAIADLYYSGQEHLTLGDYGDSKAILEEVGLSDPDIIFHCAAYKHVRLSEHVPQTYYKNNAVNIEPFIKSFPKSKLVLASTDKAAGTSKLGVSKKLAENIVSQSGGVSMRMVNALGSNGSVTHIWKKNINEFKKIEIATTCSRYFMQIEDGVHAMLMAGMLPSATYTVFSAPYVNMLELGQEFLMLNTKSPDWYEVIRPYPGEAISEGLISNTEKMEDTEVSWIKKVVHG